MKKLAILGIIIISTFSCTRDDCKTYTYYNTSEELLKYFDNYKEGNYWVYENQNGTKKDSFWISNYEEGINNYGCIKFPIRTFLLHSQFLNSGYDQFSCTIDNYGNCCLSEFRCEKQLDKLQFGIQASSDINKIHGVIYLSNFKTVSNTSVTYDTGFMDPDPLIIDPSLRDYIPTRYFAKKIGLVQFVTVDLKDTFSLTKYYIK